MDIKERYWKWKRAITKKKELISRVTSITLIVVLLGCVAFAGYKIYQSDVQRAAAGVVIENDDKIKTVKNYNYGEPGFKKVAENSKMILSADFTTGEICVTEKANGMNWYTNPQDRDADQLVTMRSRINSQIHVKFVNLEQGITVEFDNYNNSIKKGTMKHELIENGVKFTFGFTTANVYVPVQYTLTEDGFQAEIVTNEITGVGSNAFMVDTISLLPYFGAGGLNDDGYLFVPDGSGSLIAFNNEKQSMQSFSEYVYGQNPAFVNDKQSTVKETITMPVFGAKVNDHAFFGIITTGEVSSSIAATTSKKDSSYNHVYANAALTEYTLKRIANTSNVHNASHSIDFRENQTEGQNYCVRYFFLDGDQANYSGMSSLYRDYLIETNQLTKSELSDDKYVVLDLVGAVSIQKYVLGVKRPVVTALTTYDDVVEIVKEMKSKGVDNLIVNYIGAMDSGLNNKMYDKVSVESVLGSKRDFKDMISYLKEAGVLLFMETNPIDLYENGNGYQENRDSVRSFFDAYAFQYKYNIDVSTTITASRWHLLRPALVSELTAKFVSTMPKWDLENLSLNRIGNTLYSDHVEGTNAISRMKALELWHETLKSSAENVKQLMVHGGYLYTMPYADVITDTPDSHSNFDMQDQSVPFYQMVFQDSKLLTAAGINTTVDYEYAFLKALETGCSLKYNLIYGNVSDLVGTDYNTMVSYSYDYWKGLAAEQYAELQKAAKQLAGKKFLSHESLTEDVVLSLYESAAVVINYGSEPYTYQGHEIGAKDYLILSGGAK